MIAYMFCRPDELIQNGRRDLTKTRGIFLVKTMTSQRISHDAHLYPMMRWLVINYSNKSSLEIAILCQIHVENRQVTLKAIWGKL